MTADLSKEVRELLEAHQEQLRQGDLDRVTDRIRIRDLEAALARAKGELATVLQVIEGALPARNTEGSSSVPNVVGPQGTPGEMYGGPAVLRRCDCSNNSDSCGFCHQEVIEAPAVVEPPSEGRRPALEDLFELVAALLLGGHEGCEESGLHDEDCQACLVEALKACAKEAADELAELRTARDALRGDRDYWRDTANTLKNLTDAAQREKINALTVRDAAIGVLRSIVLLNGVCRLDEHGYCQPHHWIKATPADAGFNCPYARARELVDAADKEGVR